MKWFGLVVALMAMGCDQTDIENSSGGTVTVDQCSNVSEKPSALDVVDAGADADPPGVVATCDDHLPCTVDIQCMPCSAVPESIRYIKATCTPDNELSSFCFDGFDVLARQLLHRGCVHIIQDPTPPGVKNACFPVEFPEDPESEVHSGACNAIGQCVENP